MCNTDNYVDAMDDPAAVEAVVDEQLGGVRELDEDIFAYILGIVKDVDSHGCDPETLAETVRTLLHSCDSSDSSDSSCNKSTGRQACICSRVRSRGVGCSLVSLLC